MTLDLNKAMVEMYKQRTMAAASKRPKVEVALAANKDFIPKATFEQLYGCDQLREQVLKIVDRFKRSFEGSAKKLEWPILLSGSSGLGKTSIAEAAANYANVKMFPLFLKKMAKKTKSDFHTTLEQFLTKCLSNQPAIVLIDDLDKLNGKEERIDLLTDAMDRLLEEDLDLLVFCTTSSILDEYYDIKFPLQIQLKRPDLEARYKILESLSKRYGNLSSLGNESLKMLSLNTPSFTPLDLRMMFDLAETESRGVMVTLNDCTKSIEIIKQSFTQGTHLIGEKPKTTWEDIGGMSEVRSAFIDILKELKTGDVDCQFAGIALYGPPGCGKTMVAKAMANEAGLNFISINPTELQNKFFGETERNIRKVFREAREYEPCVIYFDEFDGLCGTRGSKDNMTNAIQTLLSEMDGFASRGKSIILASTNRLEDIDPAMKRPGRLSKHIYVGPPDELARKDILQVLLKRHKLVLSDGINLDDWSKETKNFTGADLAFLIYEARQKLSSDLNYCDTSVIHQRHFETAMQKIKATNRELDNKNKGANLKIKPKLRRRNGTIRQN